jgi:hypothetical protein
MIQAAGYTVHGEWHPFVTIGDDVRSSEQFVRFTKIAAIVNVALMISLVCTWVGLCIGGAVQVWELLKHIRKQGTVSQQPASVQLR